MSIPSVPLTKVSSAFMDPKKIVDSLGIEKGDIVADLGSGAGYFAILFSKAVIPKGRVYVVDIVPESLELVKSKAKAEGLANLEYIQADLENEKSVILGDSSVNFVIIINTLFQLKNKANIFREAKRILMPGGKLVVIDWMPGTTVMGPADAEKISAEQVRIASLINGLKEVKYWFPDAYHYGFIFIK